MPNTQYVNLSDETELRLASILSLTGERKSTISLSYTGSEPKYEEKILNMKWSLSGNWKIVDLVRVFPENAKAFEQFCSILRTAMQGNIFEFRQVGRWLFNLTYLHGVRKIEVEGRDFDTGIANLFTELTAFQIVETKDFEQPAPLPRLIIECEGENLEGFYNIYCWVQSLQCFKNIRSFNETPDYLSAFRNRTENVRQPITLFLHN